MYSFCNFGQNDLHVLSRQFFMFSEMLGCRQCMNTAVELNKIRLGM